MFSPSEDPSPLISISSVTATQLTGPVATPLTTGTLYLTTPPPALSPLPKLLLQISSLSSRTYTLPLTASTSIFSDSERTFLINTDDLTTTITFPTTVSSSTALKFEKILLAHGFLSTGLVADADDIAGAMRDSATKTVEKLQSYTSRRVQTRERAEPWEEKEYSERAKKVMSGTVDGTDKAAEVTGRVGRAVSSAAESIGEWVGGIMPGKKEGQEGGVAKEAVKGAVEGMGVVGAGAAESAQKVAGTVGESTSRIAEHEHGPEANKMVDGGREATANVGKVVYDVATGTSVAWHAGEAGFAATRVGTSD